MQTWSEQDAKARFSEFLEACVSKGPQIVTSRGTEIAVLLPIEEWQRLQAAARPSIKQLLLMGIPRIELLVPKRGKTRRHKPLSDKQPQDT